MKRIPTKIVKDRSRRLTRLFESFHPYESYVHQTLRVWFCTEVSDDSRSVGHTKSYVKVLVPLDGNLPGRHYYVKITGASRFHIEGEIVSDQDILTASSADSSNQTTITTNVNNNTNNQQQQQERHLRRQQNLLKHHEQVKRGLIKLKNIHDEDDEDNYITQNHDDEEDESNNNNKGLLTQISQYIVMNMFIPINNRLFPPHDANDNNDTNNKSTSVLSHLSITKTSLVVLACIGIGMSIGTFQILNKYHRHYR